MVKKRGAKISIIFQIARQKKLPVAGFWFFLPFEFQ
jgi:hypothetical protein